jgi:hypothetical protein
VADPRHGHREVISFGDLSTTLYAVASLCAIAGLQGLDRGATH